MVSNSLGYYLDGNHFVVSSYLDGDSYKNKMTKKPNKIVEEELRSEWKKVLLKPESFVFGLPSTQHQERMWTWIKEQLDRVADEARFEGYKQGVADEIECVKTSGEHLDLQKRLQQLSKGK